MSVSKTAVLDPAAVAQIFSVPLDLIDATDRLREVSEPHAQFMAASMNRLERMGWEVAAMTLLDIRPSEARMLAALVVDRPGAVRSHQFLIDLSGREDSLSNANQRCSVRMADALNRWEPRVSLKRVQVASATPGRVALDLTLADPAGGVVRLEIGL